MNPRLFMIVASFLLLCGCIIWPWKNCGTDKGCLEEAFKKCEMAYGMWEAEHSDINVTIIGTAGDACTVNVTAAETDLNISGKSMICVVSKSENVTFSILENCTGELKNFITE